LSGHGFYAFHLATDVEAPIWHEERPVPPDLPVLVGTGGGTLFDGAEDGEAVNQLMARRARDQLERQIIPRFFRSSHGSWTKMRRWRNSNLARCASGPGIRQLAVGYCYVDARQW
jgi:hypothetical protein